MLQQQFIDRMQVSTIINDKINVSLHKNATLTKITQPCINATASY
jgi:hypothetical protein